MNPQAEKYLETLDRSTRTVKTYRWALNYYFNLVGEELNEEAYERFLIAIRNLSLSTRYVLKTAVMDFYLFCDAGNIAKRMKLNKHYLRKKKATIVNFNRDAIEKIISHCESLTNGLEELRDRAFVLMLSDSGFRISEIVGLKRGNVDWQEERVTISGKGDKPAVIRLSSRSVKALKDYLSARSEMDSKTGKPLNTLPLFAQHGRINKTKAMSIDGMRQAIKERVEECGFNRNEVRIHDFRHYFVTVTYQSSNIMVAKEFARHESIGMTEKYTHLVASELDKQYDDIFNKRS